MNNMESCLVLGILLIAFGAFVLIKLYWPRKWEFTTGTVAKKSEGQHPTFCIKTEDGQAGWSPYYKKDENVIKEGDSISVAYYKKRNGDVVVVPRNVDTEYLISKKHAVISLVLGVLNIFAYLIV